MSTHPQSLTEFEQSLISLGISAATAFSLPKSVGAMFGLAFASAEPLALDDFVERLDISKGSASQGLRFLQRMGAVHAVYFTSQSEGNLRPAAGDLRPNRTYYEPETSLRRLLIGILNENVVPHLQQSGDAVVRLREQLNGIDKDQRKVLENRLDNLESWGKKGRMLFPVVERFLAAPLKGKK